MPDKAGQDGAGRQPLRTLADKVNWIIEQAHPAGRGPLSNAEVTFLIHTVTGDEISVTTLWKLRNGQQANPQLRVLQALATTFGVDPAFFFDDYDEKKLGLLRDQVELIALVRDAGITSAQFRMLLGMDDEGRKVFADMIRRVARTEAEAQGRDQEENDGNS
jgi:transcriptional regulator with XRE-family HTH domain